MDLNVGDSIVRARYRNSLEHAELMKAGEVYPFTIEMYPTSLVFKEFEVWAGSHRSGPR